MLFSTPHKRIINISLGTLVGLLVISCGSYQQASYYDNDGIYASGTARTEVYRPSNTRTQEQQTKSNTYGDYFGQKANEYGEILDSEIFTDVDGYYSGTENDSTRIAYEGDYFNDYNNYNGNPAWGDNPTNVSINIYDGPGLGFYGFGSPWGWNNFGWGGYGWNNWGWGGYGYGWGWAGNHYYNNRSYAYNAGRRGYYSNNAITGTGLRGRSNQDVASRSNSTRYRTNSTTSSINNRTGLANRNSGVYRSGSSTRSNVSVDAIERNQAYRTNRSTRALPSYGTTNRSYQSNRSGTTNGTYRTSVPRTSGYTQPSRSSGSYQNSGSSTYRSSGNTGGSYRSSGNSTSRSSGSFGSSGGASRSSGASSGGGRSSGGGGRSSGGRSN